MPSSSLAQEKKHTMLTTGSVERVVCVMAVPTIFTMMVSAFYNMADTYFVGQLGTSAVAGVATAFSIMSVIQAAGFFFGHGSGNYMSRRLGEKNADEAAVMAATGMCSSFGVGLVLGVLGLFFIKRLCVFLGATTTSLPYAVKYVRFILIAMPFMCSSLTINNQLRLQGSAFYGMIGMLSGAVINVVLDPIFIFVLKLGVTGAGLATMISQACSCVILFFMTAREGNVRIHFDNAVFNGFYYKEIIRGGLPSLIRQGAAGLSLLMLNRFARVYGDAAVAAMSVASRTTSLSFSAMIGLGQGFQPVCGFNYGAKLYSRVKRAFWFLVKLSCILLTFLGVVEYIFAPEIIAFFRRDDLEVIKIGAAALRYQCLAFPLLAWTTACNMTMQIVGETAKASFLALSRQGICYWPSLYLLEKYFGIVGIEFAQTASDFVSFAFSLTLGLIMLKNFPKRDGEPISKEETRT